MACEVVEYVSIAVHTGGGSQFPDLVNHKYTVRRWIVFSQ